MKSLRDISRDILKIEKPYFSFKYKGIPLWWFTRVKLLNEIYFQQTGTIFASAEKISPTSIVNKIVDSINTDLFQQHDILCISTSSARRDTINGKDFDIYFDFLMWSSYFNSYAILETPDQLRHSKRPATASRYYGDGIIICGNLARKVSELHGDIKEINDFSHEVFSALSELGYNLDYQRLNKLFHTEYRYVTSALPLAGKYLDKIRPKVLLVENGYSPSRMIIQYESKKRGIPVIEMQHGMIVPDYLGYFFNIPSKAQLSDSPFPDKIAVYGTHFQEVLFNNMCISEDNISVVGNPYLWHKLRNKKKFSKDGNTVIIATQPEYSGYFIDLILMLIRRTEFNIIVKPHPAEVFEAKEKYGRIINKRVKLISSNVSIYDLFHEADYHVAVASMTHLESIAFGLKDIIITKDGFNDYFNFLKEKGVPAVDNIDEIIDILNKYPALDSPGEYITRDAFSLHLNPLKEMEGLLQNYL